MTRLPSALRPLFPWLKTGVLHATQAVSPLTRRLPGATPPRHAARTAADYARAHPDGGVDVVEVVAALDLHRPLPAGLPPTTHNSRRTVASTSRPTSWPPSATAASWRPTGR